MRDRIMRVVAVALLSMAMIPVWSADSLTAVKSIETIQISDVQGTSSATYYVKAVGGWGVTSGPCVAATYVYFWQSEVSAPQMYAMLLTAKTTNRKIRVYGTCVSGYIYAENVDLFDN